MTCYRMKAVRILLLKLLPLPSHLLHAYLQYLQCSKPRKYCIVEPYGIHR